MCAKQACGRGHRCPGRGLDYNPPEAYAENKAKVIPAKQRSSRGWTSVLLQCKKPILILFSLCPSLLARICPTGMCVLSDKKIRIKRFTAIVPNTERAWSLYISSINTCVWRYFTFVPSLIPYKLKISRLIFLKCTRNGWVSSSMMLANALWKDTNNIKNTCVWANPGFFYRGAF